MSGERKLVDLSMYGSNIADDLSDGVILNQDASANTAIDDVGEDGCQTLLLKEQIKAYLKDQNDENIIREHESSYIVYIDKRNNLRWKLSEDIEYSESSGKVLMEVESLSVLPIEYLNKKQYLAWAGMLGNAISLISSDRAVGAKTAVDQAQKFIRLRAKEKARIWMVEASIFTSGFTILACLIAWGYYNANAHVLLALTSMGFSVIGAQFSVLTRLHDIKVDPSAGRAVHWEEAIIRIMSGMFAGLITYVALKSDIIFSFVDLNIKDTVNIYDDRYFWVLAFMSTLAGFSERFVPGFLDKIEDTTVKKINDGRKETTLSTEGSLGT